MTKRIRKTMYQADDGTVFKKEQEARYHEVMLLIKRKLYDIAFDGNEIDIKDALNTFRELLPEIKELI